MRSLKDVLTPRKKHASRKLQSESKSQPGTLIKHLVRDHLPTREKELEILEKVSEEEKYNDKKSDGSKVFEIGGTL